ncbi:hypothetical protein SDJN03_09638, partial [Cucurbita argyrosperma subsp. sororia]
MNKAQTFNGVFLFCRVLIPSLFIQLIASSKPQRFRNFPTQDTVLSFAGDTHFFFYGTCPSIMAFLFLSSFHCGIETPNVSSSGARRMSAERYC